MTEIKNRNGLTFRTHRPKDSLDVGFTIPGMKLRWVAARQTEDKFGRPWKTLKKTDLPEKLVEDLVSRGLFANGDTIRRNELVLAFANEEVVEKLRKEIDAASKAAMARLQQNPNKDVALDRAQTDISEVSANNYRT